MKLVTILLFLSLLSCKNNTVTEDVKSQYKKEKCNSDSLHTYQLYIPSHSNECGKMPVIIILDPHGSGDFAIKKFFESADNYKCMLAASNMVRNNMENFIPAIEILVNDVKSRYSVESVYIAGFSGGARMALSYANTNKIDGLLISGAFASADHIINTHCNVFGIMGLADFNFAEALPYILFESTKPVNLNIQITGDKHEWPSSKDISFAIGTLLLKNKTSKDECKNLKELQKTYVSEQKKNLDSLKVEDNYLFAKIYAENILSITDIDDKKLKNTYDNLKESSALKEEFNYLNKSLQFEQKAREAYYNALFTKNSEWWKNELDELEKAINKGGEKFTRYSYKRVKAYLGILCYSMAKKTLNEDDLKNASIILEIYSIVEPENPDMFFFTSVLEYKTGKKENAVSLLKNAIKKGFTDNNLIKEYFPSDIL